MVDKYEVDTDLKLAIKEKEIRHAIESIDPSIGVFQVEHFQ